MAFEAAPQLNNGLQASLLTLQDMWLADLSNNKSSQAERMGHLQQLSYHVSFCRSLVVTFKPTPGLATQPEACHLALQSTWLKAFPAVHHPEARMCLPNDAERRC